ncbi:MAG TPA: prolyl oligopeptidase family serine peptidase [Holophagaceae bacterium]|nr:prolyl oligopeptidase family serine peptidase [Holophagaceae bacterium]
MDPRIPASTFISRMPRKAWHPGAWRLAAVLASGLLGCGGGGSDPVPPSAPQGSRGEVLPASSIVADVSRQAIDAQTALDPSLVNDTAKGGVQLVSLRYTTVDPQGNLVTAGAGLLIPDEAALPGPHPLLSHQHGTSVDRTFDTASAAPDSLAASMAALYASHGYVVVMPNYLGYAGSSVDWHAYLQARPSGEVVVDALRAARNWLKANHPATHLSGDVYLSGTSQGGYVTLATQQLIEASYASEFHLQAVAPTSGPYDLESTFVGFLSQPDDPQAPKTTAAAFSLYGFQRSYGDVYPSSATQVFNTPWAGNFVVGSGVAPFLPGPYPGEPALRSHCILPTNVWSDGGPQVGSCSATPLLQAGFRTDFLAATAGTPGGEARRHTHDNSLVRATGSQTWTPMAPLTVLYGSLDPMATPNAQTVAARLAGARAVDVQTDTATTPLYVQAWMQANAHQPDYHGGVEAPGCTSYTRNVLFPIPH